MKRCLLGVLVCAAVSSVGASAFGQNVVISQIYGGGGATTGTPTYTHDYVELLNTGPAAVDINGWSVQYAAATGSTWSGTGTTVLATVSTILQPGQYFLVRLGTATGAIGGTIPVVHDASGSTAMSATTGKVAVVSSSTALTGTCPTGVIDLVGYGTTANCREPFTSVATADNAPAPTNSGFGLIRLLDGCFDTNRNRFDLINVANPVPRNSGSPFATCGTATDLGIAVTGGVCPSTVGAAVSYSFTVSNFGAASSDATVAVNIPAGFNFVSSTPSGALSMGTLTVALGTISGGGSAGLTVDLTIAAPGGHLLTGAVTGTTTDPVVINNSFVSASSHAPGGAVNITGIYSSLGTATNSTVPTGVSAASQFLFTASTSQDVFGRPWVSSDGRWMMIKAKNNLGTTLDDMLLRYDLMNNTASIVAQEGATDLGGGELLGVIDFQPTINTAGDFAYSVETTAATTSDDVVVKNIGGASTVVAREGNSDGFGGTIATSVTSWSILNNGDLMWGHLLNSTAANDLESLILDSAVASIVARANDGGTTAAPTGQVGGTTFLWKLFNPGSDLGQISQMSPDGANVLIHGDLEGGTTDPDAVAVNGAIVVMDGQTVGTTAGVVATINNANLRGSHWTAYGSNATDDWVLHDGNVVAQTGGPIFTGATEFWGDSSFTATFFIAGINANGDYIVGGVTDAADDNANAVLVLNGTTVVARENDPVDLDGNGIFDDDAYIRTFRDDRIYLTDSRLLILPIETRNAAGYCAGNAKTADVLVRIQLAQVPATGACCSYDQSGAYLGCVVTTEDPGCQSSTTRQRRWLSGVPCLPNPCPATLAGACCAADGGCTTTGELGCADTGGTFQGVDTVCTPNPCPQPNGACCCGSNCSITASDACVGANRTFAGAGTTCTPLSNTVPCCRGDYNKSGTPPTVQDIFDFLAGYFGNDSCADSNDSGGVNSVQDIFDFLAAYFGGC